MRPRTLILILSAVVGGLVLLYLAAFGLMRMIPPPNQADQPVQPAERTAQCDDVDEYGDIKSDTTAAAVVDACSHDIASGWKSGHALAVDYNNRGLAYRLDHQPDKAIADFDEALALAPDLARAMNNRGLVYEDQRQFDRAIADFDAGLALTPDDGTLRNNRGLAYLDKGQYDRALQDLDQAIRLRPQDAFAHNNRGMAIAARCNTSRPCSSSTRRSGSSRIWRWPTIIAA
jgi:tetratricopeptide (TPR) repeat protein